MFVLRDISLILLAIEGAAVTLLVLAALAVVNYGLFRLRWWHAIPQALAVVRGYLGIARQIVERVCRAVVAPIFALARVRAALVSMVRRTGAD